MACCRRDGPPSSAGCVSSTRPCAVAASTVFFSDHGAGILHAGTTYFYRSEALWKADLKAVRSPYSRLRAQGGPGGDVDERAVRWQDQGGEVGTPALVCEVRFTACTGRTCSIRFSLNCVATSDKPCVSMHVRLGGVLWRRAANNVRHKWPDYLMGPAQRGALYAVTVTRKPDRLDATLSLTVTKTSKIVPTGNPATLTVSWLPATLTCAGGVCGGWALVNNVGVM